MEPEKAFQIGICHECSTKDMDSSQKRVSRCEICNKWFCETHLKPKFPYFVDWDTFFDVQGNPEIKVLFHTEYKREGGHPDFVYLRKTIEALEIEESIRNKLIKQTMDRMMQSRKPAKKKSVHKPIETEVEEMHRLIKEAGMRNPVMEDSLKEAETKASQVTFAKKETKTTENKHGYGFWVPTEVYSDKEYREKLNNATTMHEVGLIVNDYYKRNYVKEDLEKPKKKKHWWQ